jgi:hypothetical protein
MEPGFIIMTGPHTESKTLMSLKLAENNQYVDLAQRDNIMYNTFSKQGHQFRIGPDVPQFNIKMVLSNFQPSHQCLVERMVNKSKEKGYSIVLLCESLDSLSKSLQSKVNYVLRDDTPDSKIHKWQMYSLAPEIVVDDDTF